MGIRSKLTLIILTLCMAVVLVLTGLFYFQFDTALRDRVFLQLSSVKTLKMVKVREVLQERAEALEKYPAAITSSEFELVRKFSDWPKTFEGHSIANDSPIEGQTIIKDITTADRAVITLLYATKRGDEYLIGITEVPEIQTILLERTGLGESGESYIVAADSTLRTQSRFYSDSSFLSIEVKTAGVAEGLAGTSGKGIFNDYRDVEVFSSYEPIDLYGLNWVLLSEIDLKEALMPIKELRSRIIYILLFTLLIVLVISFFTAKLIVRPVLKMEGTLERMSRGVLKRPLYKKNRADEIGLMYKALEQLIQAMEQTITFAHTIGEGNFDAEYTALSKEDELGASLLKMRDQLKLYHKKEEQLTIEKQLSLVRGQEIERSRLAKEMHDGLGPLLTSMRLRIQSLYLPEGNEAELLTLLDQTITEVRRMSNHLMPSVLEDFGLGEAIANLTLFLQNMSGIKIQYKDDLTDALSIPDDISVALYRIAQETLNNVVKHAQATEIRLSVTQFDDYVSFYVEDNGNGFDINKKYSGHGLLNIKDRVAILKGTMHLNSNTQGTIIEIEIPLT
ncbi:sensor histidine kinase [Fulvivirga ligni]|uniref:sensor histidine kinase n=1 Tax=Fulvivirga ligni TaxID=2904246 RepID=UPI001F389CED|nr:ATP-binding protein [Fulvivirga ligni]UII19634.1 HAMP domain-containing protein [Fulvivirga ligni]